MSSDNRPAVLQQDMKPIGQPRKPQLSVETALAGLLETETGQEGEQDAATSGEEQA